MPAPPEDPPPPAGDADAPAPAPGPDPAPTAAPAPAEEEDDRVFLVPRRWWRDAQEGAAIDAAGLPYVAAPAGPTSYGMRVLSIFISDQTYTLRRADNLLHQPPDASSSARSYALVAADLFTKARD